VLSDKEVADKKQLHIAYNKSAAGMEITRRFLATPKGKACASTKDARYRATPKGRASIKRGREIAGASEEAGNKRARVLQESTFESNSRPAVQQKTYFSNMIFI
jgi:hypothetical protein